MIKCIVKKGINLKIHTQQSIQLTITQTKHQHRIYFSNKMPFFYYKIKVKIFLIQKNYLTIILKHLTITIHLQNNETAYPKTKTGFILHPCRWNQRYCRNREFQTSQYISPKVILLGV